jgi:NDP-sugar pyrophosphorylase family protein
VTLRQCAILAGGAGTRLGDLTRETPKPMLPVAGKPFLEHLITKAARHGFERVLLLAGHHAGVIEAWSAENRIAQRLGVGITLSIESAPLGTGGALVHARDRLDEAFLLVNGDTWFDFDWAELAGADSYPAMLALKSIAQADRYETVELTGDRVDRFAPRSGAGEPGLINGGVYRLARAMVPQITGALSLETALLPRLAEAGQLGAQVFDGPFIDIGVPESYAAAQALLAP